MPEIKLSVVLATRNEEANIGRCLDSVRGIADEIIVVDEHSKDKTREIAESKGAQVFLEEHHDIFHVTKQKALDKAKGEWILQLDADEVVTASLAKEIKEVIQMSDADILSRKISGRQGRLFRKHTELIEKRDGPIGIKNGKVAGFFIPRKNIFLGMPLIHAGVYPDGVIRLVRRGVASFPQVSVHEQIVLRGEVSWLTEDLEHYDSPTFKRYLSRANRYTDLTASEFKEKRTGKNPITFIYFSLIKPGFVFLNLYIRHLGFLDGAAGFIWSFFSAIHFPVAYFKYITSNYN
jgi:(heptosyl)LPS beta-1,4-glucosyltransferase